MITAEQAKELLAAATPGPWWWNNTQDVHLRGRGQPVMAFARAGMNGAQPVMLRHKDGVYEKTAKANLNDFPDARLVAAAPDLAQAVIDLTAENVALREQLAKAWAEGWGNGATYVGALEFEGRNEAHPYRLEANPYGAALYGDQPKPGEPT